MDRENSLSVPEPYEFHISRLTLKLDYTVPRRVRKPKSGVFRSLENANRFGRAQT
jgi:hypothetical protein